MQASTAPGKASAGVATATVPHLLRLASDAGLVRLIRDGHPRAFDAAYERHHRAILSFCAQILGDVHEAEDAVQHTFLAAYVELVSSQKPIHLRAWLFTIARNRCYSVLRGRRELPVAGVEESPSEGLAVQVQRREDLRDLVVDMQRLPPEQRAALVLAELEALSHEQIGHALGVPRTKVKALVFQARESLLATRIARETECSEIRLQLATQRGAALRRRNLRRHLAECPGCRAYRRQMERQSRLPALVLPLGPALALRKTVLGRLEGRGSSAGVGGGAGGAGLVLSVPFKSGLIKGGACLLLAGLGTAGTVAVTGSRVLPGPGSDSTSAAVPGRAQVSPARGGSSLTLVTFTAASSVSVAFWSHAGLPVSITASAGAGSAPLSAPGLPGAGSSPRVAIGTADQPLPGEETATPFPAPVEIPPAADSATPVEAAGAPLPDPATSVAGPAVPDPATSGAEPAAAAPDPATSVAEPGPAVPDPAIPPAALVPDKATPAAISWPAVPDSATIAASPGSAVPDPATTAAERGPAGPDPATPSAAPAPDPATTSAERGPAGPDPATPSAAPAPDPATPVAAPGPAVPDPAIPAGTGATASLPTPSQPEAPTVAVGQRGASVNVSPGSAGSTSGLAGTTAARPGGSAGALAVTVGADGDIGARPGDVSSGADVSGAPAIP